METGVSKAKKKALLVLSCIFLAMGTCGAPLLTRLYFIHGGRRTWLSTWLGSSGWPVTLLPLTIAYFIRRKTKGYNAQLVYMKLPTFIACIVLGVVLAPTNYLYTFGVGHLPVSTSTLIGATTLAFTAIFAFFIVKQKFTPYSINTIFLLTLGAASLALHAGADKPQNQSKKLYVLGFIMMFAAASLNGLIFPVMELVYKKSNQTVNYTLVMEVQMVISFFSTLCNTVVMIINKDFEILTATFVIMKGIAAESRKFELGETIYYVVLVSTAILWQLSVLGSVGILFGTSALVTGIMSSFLLPISEVLAVIFFHEKFGGEKGVALALSLWGFVSYLYGEWKLSKQKKNLTQEAEMIQYRVTP